MAVVAYGSGVELVAVLKRGQTGATGVAAVATGGEAAAVALFGIFDVVVVDAGFVEDAEPVPVGRPAMVFGQILGIFVGFLVPIAAYGADHRTTHLVGIVAEHLFLLFDCALSGLLSYLIAYGHILRRHVGIVVLSAGGDGGAKDCCE